MGATAEPLRFNLKASIAMLLVMAIVAGSALWQSSVRPVSAQVDAWSCDGPATASPSASPAAVAKPDVIPFTNGRLIVFAAASLTDAFTKMGDDIMAANPDVLITFNFAGSQTLVTQIAEGGASADVLALASPNQMTDAIESGINVDSPSIFTTNRLSIVVPADNPAHIVGPADLGNDGIRLVLANPDVPAGAYARQSLCKIGAADDGYVDSVAGSIVSEEDNVRSVLTKVQLGEADAGIVYRSDALAGGDQVQTIDIPIAENVIATYPIASLDGDRLGAAFVSYVLSPDGQATLASYGFDPVE
jgi:molybdate transport system substrate-binding protein